MTHDPTTARVTAQYQTYSYPPPIMDLAAAVQNGSFLIGDPAKFSAMIWPEGRAPQNLNILVAGCGTYEAAFIAFCNPSCRVLGIDLSEPSLAHEQYLKDKHGLKNLTLERRDLRDIGGRGPFDYIVCGGVLHHLGDPDAGLHSLAAELSPDGAMFLMLYGRAARAGVYLMQDIFRRLGVRQDAQGVAFVKEALDAVPPSHYVRHFMAHSASFPGDAELVDTYLHPQDRAYSVAEVLDFVRRNGLVFQGWTDNGKYTADALPQNTALERATRALSPQEQWSIVEAVTLTAHKHVFLACRPERDPAGYTVSFEGDAWLTYVPVRHAKSGMRNEPAKDAAEIELTREQIKFFVSPGGAALFFAADGTKTIAEILREERFAQIPPAQRTENARRFFERMWQGGHMFFTKRAV